MSMPRSALRLASTTVLATLALLLVAGARPAPAQSFGYQAKSCGRCGSPVSLASQVGQTCPQCGAYWGRQVDRVVEGPVAGTPRRLGTRGRGTVDGSVPTPVDVDSSGGRW